MLGLINLLRPVLWKRFYFFFLPTITIYFLLILFLGDRLNIYDSDIYYLNWLDELREIAFDSNFLKNIAIATNSTLAAPEIIAVFPYWFLSLLFESNYSVIYTLNIFYIVFLLCAALYARVNNILLLLVCLCLLFGIYDNALLYMTHRFKVAVIFFLLSLGLYRNTRSSSLAEFFLVSSFVSHLSMLVPILIYPYLMARAGLNYPRIRLKYLALYSILYVFAYYGTLFGNEVQGVQILFNKLEFINFEKYQNLFTYLFIAFILMLPFYHKILYIFNRYWHFVFVAYVGFTLYFIGPSRLLSVYSFFLTVIFLVYYFDMRKLDRQLLTSVYIVLFVWQMFKGFYLGPIGIVLGLERIG